MLFFIQENDVLVINYSLSVIAHSGCMRKNKLGKYEHLPYLDCSFLPHPHINTDDKVG